MLEGYWAGLAACSAGFQPRRSIQRPVPDYMRELEDSKYRALAAYQELAAAMNTEEGPNKLLLLEDEL